MPAVTADLGAAILAMAAGYLLRFTRAELSLVLGPAVPVLLLIVLVQVLTAARMGLYRSPRPIVPLLIAAAVSLLLGFVLAQLGLAPGVSRFALICQAVLFVGLATAWRQLVISGSAQQPELVIDGRLRAMLPGAIIGIAMACLALDPGFVLGTGHFWDRPEHDFNAYLVAWQYFLHDTWRWPLLDLPAMGYPEGGSVLFNDALPIGAIPSKLIYGMTGIMINPFGLWIFATYVLLGGFVSRLVHDCGIRSPLIGAAVAFLVIGKAVFMWRLGHVAISGHFLIVWALCLYVEDIRTGKFSAARHWWLGAATILINAYLLAMVALIQAATVLTLLSRARFGTREVMKAVAVVAGVIAVGWVEGYGAMFRPGPHSMRAGGFGEFSWNVATLIVPPDYLWGVTGVVRDATGGQYEGEAYLGMGTLVLVALIVVLFPRRIVAVLRRHWILAAVLAAAMLFAGSNRLYIGSLLVYDVALPERLLELAALFRASGRFIWLTVYAVTVFAAVACLRWLPRRAAVICILIAVALHAAELPVITRNVRAVTQSRPGYIVDDDQFNLWMSDHSRVFLWPAYSCGALVPNTAWGSMGANRELHLQLLAARLGRPNNSVYTSRQLKDCATELQWADQPDFDEGVLYVVGKARALESPALIKLVTASSCLDAGYAFICSRGNLRDDSNPESALHVEPMAVSGCNSGDTSVRVSWKSADSRPVRIRLGVDGEPIGEGVAGQRDLSLAAGTNVLLRSETEGGADEDIESVYYRTAECGEAVESR